MRQYKNKGGASIQIKGLRTLSGRLDEFGERAKKAVKEAVIDSNNEIAEEMKGTSLFADKTGKLRGSITTEIKETSELIEAKALAKAPHAHLVELGHALVKDGKTIGSVAARPFARTAFGNKKAKAKSNIRKAINGAVKASKNESGDTE